MQKDIKWEAKAKMHLELGKHLETGSMIEGKAIPVTTGLARNSKLVLPVPLRASALSSMIAMVWNSRSILNR